MTAAITHPQVHRVVLPTPGGWLVALFTSAEAARAWSAQPCWGTAGHLEGAVAAGCFGIRQLWRGAMIEQVRDMRVRALRQGIPIGPRLALDYRRLQVDLLAVGEDPNGPTWTLAPPPVRPGWHSNTDEGDGELPF